MLMMVVIYWNYFETVSGCFRAFPINYVTLNSTSGAGWGFRTEKKDFWAKSSVLAARRLSLSISWLEQSPICRLWTLKGWELSLLLRQISDWCVLNVTSIPFQPWHKGWSIYQKEVGEIKTDTPLTDRGKKWDQEQTQACFAILTNPFSDFIRQNGTWDQNRFRPNNRARKLDQNTAQKCETDVMSKTIFWATLKGWSKFAINSSSNSQYSSRTFDDNSDMVNQLLPPLNHQSPRRAVGKEGRKL